MNIFTKAREIFNKNFLSLSDSPIFLPILLGLYALFASVSEGYFVQFLFFAIVCVFLEIGFAAIFHTKKNFYGLTYEASIIFLLLNLDTFFNFLVAVFVSILIRYIRQQHFSQISLSSVLCGLFVADLMGGSLSWWGFSIVPLSYLVFVIALLFMFLRGQFWSSLAFILLFFIMQLALTANLSFVFSQLLIPGFLLFSVCILHSPIDSLGTYSYQKNLKRGFLTAMYAVGLPLVGYSLDPLISGLLFSELTLAILDYSSHNGKISTNQ